MIEEMICTPLDLAICSGEMMVNQVVFTYSITDMMTPMSRTTAETESRTPRRRLDPAEGGDLDDLLEEAAQQDYAEADHDYDDDERKHFHYVLGEGGRHAVEPAREHGREPACQEYTENEAHDAAELPHQAVLDTLEHRQGQEYENDDIYNCHDMRR